MVEYSRAEAHGSCHSPNGRYVWFSSRVGFTGCQFGSKFAQAWGKDDMLLTLGSIFLIKGGCRIIGLHVFRLQIMPFTVGGKLKGFENTVGSPSTARFSMYNVL